LGQFRVEGTLEGGEGESVGALDNGLTLAIQRKGAVIALEGPELLGGGDEGDSLAISNEDGGLAWGDKDEAILAIVDVEIGRNIEDEEGAVATSIYIVLLFLDGVDGFNLERTSLVEVPIVVGVVLLFHCFWLEDVGSEGGLRLCGFRLHQGLLLNDGPSGGCEGKGVLFGSGRMLFNEG
jgi:hypothetical protein